MELEILFFYHYRIEEAYSEVFACARISILRLVTICAKRSIAIVSRLSDRASVCLSVCIVEVPWARALHEPENHGLLLLRPDQARFLS